MLNINCGVPQGSILGSMLFLLYINDIHNSTSLNLLSFADDTTVFASSSNIPMLTNQIYHELTQIHKWLCTNKLSLNVSKTKYSVFNSSPNIPNIPENAFVLNNTIIKRTGTPTDSEQMKFLGLRLDEKLTWQSHISFMTSKLASSIYIINKVKHEILYITLKTLYYSLFHSYITYGISVWGSSDLIKK